MIKSLILAARLRTLPLSISGILMGSSIAIFQGKFRLDIFIMACITTILYQILSNFANDFGDGIKGTDKNRIGPKRALQSGLLTKHQLKKAIFITIILSLISTFYLLYISFIPDFLNQFLIFILLGIACILAAIFYTIGKKAYGYNGLGDLFVFIFFGLVAVAGSNYLFTKTFDFYILLPASSVGFLAVAVLNLNNMRDIENDKLNNKNTLAVILGLKKAKIYQILLLNFPFFMSLTYIFIKCKPVEYHNLIFLALIFIFGPIRRQILFTSNPKEFDPFLKKIALLTLVFVILFSLSLNYKSVMSF